MATRVSQETAEALVSTSNAKASQVVLEGVIASSNAILSQLVSEGVISRSTAYLSQVTIEGMLASSRGAKVSQVTIELVRPFDIAPDPTPPRVYGTIIG